MMAPRIFRFSALATIAVCLSACTQPGDTLTAGNERAPASVENTRRDVPARPTGAEASPGPGAPSGPVSTGITADELPGQWLLQHEDGRSCTLELQARPDTAAGSVSALCNWSFDTPQPASWLYLAFGQLTLIGETGAATWQGTIRGDEYTGQFTGDRAKVTLRRP